MMRHQVRFVLGFGVFDEFRQILDRLGSIEERHGWAEQRCWRATSGRMNEMVVEHDYQDRAAHDAQRDRYHDVADDDFAAALRELAELMVPGTATDTLFEEL